MAVTRPAAAADDLTRLLAGLGAEPLQIPLIRIVAEGDEPLRACIRSIDRYDWVVFTSATAVERVAAAVPAAGRVPRVAVVGAATGESVRSLLQWPVAAMPVSYTADGVVEAMLGLGPLRGRRILWPRAADARTAIAEQLAEAGADLDAIVVYRTVCEADAAVELRRRVELGDVDVVTFTSPSAVHCYAAAGPWTEGARVAVIGPVTAAACATHGVPVHIVPSEHTIAALVDALVQGAAG